MSLTTDQHDKLLLSRLQLFRNVDLDNQALLDLLSQCEYRQPGHSLDIMIAGADVAMYHARRNGKNRVELAANVPVDK